jgi:predicted HicB family RNase H-like nuclease
MVRYKGLHAALAQAAKREGVSLNLYIASALARVVGFH